MATLSLPVVSLYGASDPALTGTYGRRQLHMNSSLSCSPCRQRTCSYRGPTLEDDFNGARFSVEPACYRTHPPKLVWGNLSALMAGGQGTLDGLFYPA